MATQLVLDLCGGEASEVVVAGETPDTSRAYQLDPARVVSLVGMEISRNEQVRILADLGFEAHDKDYTLEVSVPSWRPDVHGEADLIEEIARVASLTKLVGVPMPRPSTGVMKAVLTPMQKRQGMVRRTIATLGYNECVTYSFIDKASAELFGGGSDGVMLGNPISSEMSHMRPTLLPSLLQAAAKNQARGFADFSLFEVGQGFEGGEPEDQKVLACGVRIGSTAPRNSYGTARAVDLYDAKADAEAALAAIGAPVDRLMVMRNAPEWFHPGRSAVLSLGPKNPLAVFGELHPKVLAEMGVKGPAVAFTLFLENAPFPKAKTKTRPALVISDFQAVERDFAFVVDANVEVEALLKAANGAHKKLIDAVNLFDVFHMDDGKKSVAISVRIQPTAGTLTDKEIDAISDQVIAKVSKATGGILRG
jgi:phenylalanyl-tRNA synthetase beta chain